MTDPVIVKRKVSAMTQASSLEGLMTYGVDMNNNSVKIPVSLLKGNVPGWEDFSSADKRAIIQAVLNTILVQVTGDGTAVVMSQKSVTEELTKKYQKPSTGIPKSDLADAVQESLDKADTALQQSNIADDLKTDNAQKVLSAKQGVLLDQKTLRPLAEWHIDGKGNTFISMESASPVIGHTYRFYVKAWPRDEVTQTGSSYAQFVIYKNSATQANMLAGFYGTSGTVQPYYDVTIPDDCEKVILGGRVNSGAEGIVLVQDITLINEVDEKHLRPLAEMHIPSNGSSYASINNYYVLGGHTYRAYLKAWPQNNTSPTSAQTSFGIFANVEGASQTIVEVGGTNKVDEYYDFTLPAGTRYIQVGGRIDSGTEGIVVLDDITVSKNGEIRDFVPLTPLSHTDGWYYNSSGVLAESEYYGYYVYAVEGGKEYAFTARFPAGRTARFMGWLDADGNTIVMERYVGTSGTAREYTKQIVKAPSNAAFAVCNYVLVSYGFRFAFYSHDVVPCQDFYEDQKSDRAALMDITLPGTLGPASTCVYHTFIPGRSYRFHVINFEYDEVLVSSVWYLLWVKSKDESENETYLFGIYNDGTEVPETFDVTIPLDSVGIEVGVRCNQASTAHFQVEDLTVREEIMESVDEGYAKKDGYYSTLTAGSAENLVNNRSTQVLFTKRSAGGSADIGNGNASLSAIYGKTIRWNQGINYLSSGKFSASAFGAYTGSFNREVNSDGDFAITPASSTSGAFYAIANYRILTQNYDSHKVYWRYEGWVSRSCTVRARFGGTTMKSMVADGDFVMSGVRAAKTTHPANYYFYVLCAFIGEVPSGDDTLIIKRGTMYCDLTAMFGPGNEPSAAEFEALYPPKTYSKVEVSEASFYNNSINTIHTVGFNQYNPETGEASLLAGLEYQITGDYTSLSIDGVSLTPNADGKFTPKKNGTLVVTGGNPANTCVHLVWSGKRDGQFEDYWESDLDIQTRTVTGKLNGTGESVVIFPTNLKSCGSVRDELRSTIAIKRIGNVAVSELTFSDTEVEHVFKITGINVPLPSDASQPLNITISKTGAVSTSLLDAANYDIVTYADNGEIYFKHPGYTSAASLASALSSASVYFELITPEVYVLDEELDLRYRVDDFGTETAMENSNYGLFSAAVQYPMNAVDTINNLGKNYIRKESMDAILTALVDAGIIGSYALTYDADTDAYECSVTNPEDPEDSGSTTPEESNT